MTSEQETIKIAVEYHIVPMATGRYTGMSEVRLSEREEIPLSIPSLSWPSYQILLSRSDSSCAIVEMNIA